MNLTENITTDERTSGPSMISARRLFYLTLFITLAIRWVIAVYLPITTDEAYFLIWAKNPDLGFYDHPPMVGWWLAVWHYFGEAEWWLRVPSLMVTALVAWAIFFCFRNQEDRNSAYLAATLYLLLPINVVNVFITTDTPFILFAFLSAVSFYQSQSNEQLRFYALSGLFLGLAFLSKYFAVLLGVSYFTYLLFFNWKPRAWIGLLLLVFMALPSIAINLYWNYDHCWTNYLFNLVNRHDEMHTSGVNTAFYLFMLAYMITPFIFYFLIKHRQRLSLIKDNLRARVFSVLFLTPVFLFALVSPFKEIGLHWLLGFYAFLCIVVMVVLREDEIRRLILVMVLPFSVLHLLLFSWLLIQPFSFFSQESIYHEDVVLGYSPQVLIKAFEPYREDYAIAATGYGVAAFYSYHSGSYTFVMGRGSKYARQDDILTDFRQLNGKNILIFHLLENGLEEFKHYFDSYEIRYVEVKDVKVQYALGRGFHYPRYRDEILTEIRSFYTIPSFVPQGQCFYYDRYFPRRIP